MLQVPRIIGRWLERVHAGGRTLVQVLR
jgi:hypothetical protein